MPGQQPRDEWRRVASSIRWDGGVSNSNRTRTDGWTDRQHPLVLSRLKLVPSRLVSRPWLLAIMIIVLLVAIVTHSHSPPRELRSNLCRIQNIILDSMYHAQWQWEVVSLHTDICWATSLRLSGRTAEEVEIISIEELFICGCSGAALKWPLTMRVSG